MHISTQIRLCITGSCCFGNFFRGGGGGGLGCFFVCFFGGWWFNILYGEVISQQILLHILTISASTGIKMYYSAHSLACIDCIQYSVQCISLHIHSRVLAAFIILFNVLIFALTRVY